LYLHSIGVQKYTVKLTEKAIAIKIIKQYR
jgi:hypothetical protein